MRVMAWQGGGGGGGGGLGGRGGGGLGGGGEGQAGVGEVVGDAAVVVLDEAVRVRDVGLVHLLVAQDVGVARGRFHQGAVGGLVPEDVRVGARAGQVVVLVDVERGGGGGVAHDVRAHRAGFLGPRVEERPAQEGLSARQLSLPDSGRRLVAQEVVVDLLSAPVVARAILEARGIDP